MTAPLRPAQVVTSHGPGRRTRNIAVVLTDGTPARRIDTRDPAVLKILRRWDGVNALNGAVVGIEDQARAMAADYNAAFEKAHTTERVFTCPKCGGSGHIPTCDHIKGGVCFCCDGAGTLTPGKQWNKLYPTYRECSAEDRLKIKWLFKAAAADWDKLSLQQMEKVGSFIRNQLSGLFVLPPAGVARLEALAALETAPF